MKPLKPSMRDKKRYLKISGHVKDVEDALLDFAGSLGLAKINPKFVKKGKTNIISINRDALDLVRASFAVWPKRIKIDKVSGTLKGLKVVRNKKK